MKQQDHVGNLLAAQAMVEAMPNSAFYPNLTNWCNNVMRIEGPQACGALGCFGGWIAREPFFKKLGVREGIFGQPEMGYAQPDALNVSDFLFGDERLFLPQTNDETGTEKSVILARIKRALIDATEA